MKKENVSESTGSVLMMISSCGQPVALIPAESIEQAEKRAVKLLRGEQGRYMGLLTNEAVVTLFSPAVVADGETIAYVPTHVGSSHGFRGSSTREGSTTPSTTH